MIGGIGTVIQSDAVCCGWKKCHHNNKGNSGNTRKGRPAMQKYSNFGKTADQKGYGNTGFVAKCLSKPKEVTVPYSKAELENVLTGTRNRESAR